MDYKKLYELLQNNEIENAKKLVIEQIVINDSKSKSTTKGVIKLSKYAQKHNIKEGRRGLAGAIYNGSDTFIVYYCMIFVAYGEQLQGVTMVDEIDNPEIDFKYNNCFFDIDGLECQEIDKKLLIEKIANKEEIYKVDKYNFNANYLKLLLDCFENPKIYEGNHMLQIIENNKKAVLLGLRDA